MAVFVDELRQTHTSYSWPFDKACLLFADTIEELHRFASELLVPTARFSLSPPHKLPCYYLTPDQRKLALMAGALDVVNARDQAADTIREWHLRLDRAKRVSHG